MLRFRIIFRIIFHLHICVCVVGRKPGDNEHVKLLALPESSISPFYLRGESGRASRARRTRKKVSSRTDSAEASQTFYCYENLIIIKKIFKKINDKLYYVSKIK